MSVPSDTVTDTKWVSAGVPVGLSDHTLGTHVAPAAVALGAHLVEKHFTLDRTMRGPDHPFAVEPKKVDKPWGHELVWALTEDYCGKLLFVKAGESLSLQFHRKKDESWLEFVNASMVSVNPALGNIRGGAVGKSA